MLLNSLEHNTVSEIEQVLGPNGGNSRERITESGSFEVQRSAGQSLQVFTKYLH